LFTWRRNGISTIWRTRTDGSDLRQITNGPTDHVAQCLAGGTLIYRSEHDGVETAWEAPIDGGSARPAAPFAWTWYGSPDGQLVLRNEVDPSTKTRRGVVRKRGGEEVVLKLPAAYDASSWLPDSSGLVFTMGAAQELWFQAIAGGEPAQITHFGKDEIFDMS